MAVATTQEKQPKMSNNSRQNESKRRGKGAMLAEREMPESQYSISTDTSLSSKYKISCQVTHQC